MDTPATPPEPALIRGGFVALSLNGLFWTGDGWVSDERRARVFNAPPDPYATCLKEVASFCEAGQPCVVAHIADRAHVGDRDRPSPRPRRQS